VIFLAHYDTKSQLWPTAVRVPFVLTALVLSLLLTLLALASALGFPQALHSANPWLLCGAAIVALAGLAVNVTGNRSPGALDNGSGMGALLELARAWRPEVQAPVETYWLATGAGETGLHGARAFLQQHDAWLQEKPTLLINLESVGCGPCVYLAGEPHALELARQIAGELSLPHARLRIVGAGLDHQPFAARGLAAVSILGDVVRKAYVLHSSRDELKRIEQPALERAGQLAARLARRWAQMHHLLVEGAANAAVQPAAQLGVPLPRPVMTARVATEPYSCTRAGIINPDFRQEL
jgi:hypothetical protein